jgi:hypothetical protein
MHCPGCGSHASEQQKFCRTCGMNLDGLAERVAAHQGTPPRAQSELVMFLIAAGKWMAFGGVGLLLATLLLMLLSVAFGFFSKEALEFYGMKSLAIAVTLLVLGGSTLCLPMFLQRERKSDLQLKPERSSQPVTTVELLEAPAYHSSVTEHTTRELEPVLSERSKPSVSSALIPRG